MKLNYGCGETKLPGFINIDLEKKTKPDLVLDLRYQIFPYKDNTVDEIWCIHCIEHIEQQFHLNVLSEFWRVLKNKSKLVMAYPEFSECAKRFLNSRNGQRDFFRATLYGRQLYPGDYHVAPIVSRELEGLLIKSGFRNIKYGPEPKQNFNTILKAFKGYAIGREHVLKREIFGKPEETSARNKKAS